jgi:hypothetical protein
LAIRGGALVPRTGMTTLGKEECTRVELVGEKKMSHEGNNGGGGWLLFMRAPSRACDRHLRTSTHAIVRQSMGTLAKVLSEGGN